MPQKFNPPTRKHCKICEDLIISNLKSPIIDSHSGKASSANNFPFHNWYNFVLGYSPDFPKYIIEKEKINNTHIILDPFMGSATTNVVAKEYGIESYGLEANDYFINVAKVKLSWDVDINQIKKTWKTLKDKLIKEFDNIDFESNEPLAENEKVVNKKIHFSIITHNRPKELLVKYLCNRPYAKLLIINEALISTTSKSPKKVKDFFNLALSSIIVPSSNISYGPGFGVKKAKVDCDVLGAFEIKVERMIEDVCSVIHNENLKTPFKVVHGDARKLSSYFSPNSIDYMITSPPYPGDHEYTKHTKLELIFENHAKTLVEFREIKKRMLVGSTTNIYKESNDKIHVEGNDLIRDVTSLIQIRLEEDNATSGFEKLYTRLVWEYFGGMAYVFREALTLLKKGGKFSLLVSDSHAFKMVHISTANILLDIAIKEGFEKGEIELWQNKKTTSHSYNLREEILTVTK